MPTGLKQVDELLHGGLPLGGMTEIVSPVGGGLFLTGLLRSTCQRGGLLALIDGADAFDPAGVPAAALARVVWVRTRQPAQAVQAADLLLRDGNLNLVVLDLRAAPVQETRKIPASSWYRLQRVVEPAATAFVVLTRQSLVSGARPRLVLAGRFTLQALDRRQADLGAQLEVALIRGHEEPVRQFA